MIALGMENEGWIQEDTEAASIEVKNISLVWLCSIY